MTQAGAITRALIVVAHPDDVEFGAAGTVACWTDAGIQVTYCIVTDGAAGSNDPQVERTALVERRRREQLDAAACVGVSDVRFLGYTDGVLEPTLALRRDLTRLIRELKPQRVMLMDPTTVLIQDTGFDYINHPDHRASGEAALYATFPSAETRPIFPELLDEGLEPHHVSELWLTISTRPNRYVNITEVFERKIAALLCHRSQIDESIVPMIQNWDRATGNMLGVQYAESFRVMRFDQQPEAAPAQDSFLTAENTGHSDTEEKGS